MNTFVKKGLALLLAIVMVVGFVPNLSIYADAATYTYNWGVRGEAADSLSSAAVAFYNDNGVNYESLSANAGAANVDDVPESALYDALQTLMVENHSVINSYDAVKNYLPYTDCQDGDGIVYGFYTNTAMGSAWGEGDIQWSREHVWPNSKGLDGQDENDVMMLRPEISTVNSGRGNKAYGTATTTEFYYPNEECPAGIDVRGDVARVALYQYVRWGNTENMWGSAGVIESLDVLLDWMEADPVDTWELGRNDAVQSITGTRNVFVDFPALAFNLFDVEVPAGLEVPTYGSLVSQDVEVTYSSNGTVLSTVEATVGDQITLPAYTGTAPEGYEFIGWSASVVNHETTEPTVMAAGDQYEVKGETTIHAVFSYVVEEEGGSGAAGWNKISSSAELTSGKYVMVTTVNGYAPVQYASKWFTSVQPTVTGDQVTDTKGAEITLTVSADGTTTTIQGADDVYVKPSGSSSNGITTGTFNWYITETSGTFSFSYSANREGTILAANGSSGFRAYKKTTVEGNPNGYPSYFTLYKYSEGAGGTVETTYYTTHECEHTATKNVAAVAADCTNPGYTAGVQCTACDAFLSGHAWVAPKGHDYETTITAPTITYTCSVCGDSYQTALTDYYTVNFSVPAGVTAVDTEYVVDGELTLPGAGTPDETYTFLGWVEAEVSNSTTAPATIYTEGETIEITADATLYALYSFTEGGSGSTDYEATELSKIGETDKVVITMTYTDGTVYALSSANGTGSAPAAPTVTVSGDKITSTVSEEAGIVWNIAKDGDNLTIYPDGTTTTWLYCTSANNGVRVGTNANKTFVIDASSGYLKNTATSRFVGVYRTNPDWRCYTSTTTNIGNQTLTFYVKGEAGTTYYTTGTCSHPDAHDVAEEPADCENPGYTAGVYCPDCEIYISGHTVIDALGHDYEAVVTPPTATEQGYTTHTCSVCGDSYQDTFVPAVGETYTVTFWAPDYAYAPEAQEGNLTGIELPAMAAPEGYTFLGWTAARIEDETEAPEYFKAGETYAVTANTTLYALYSYSVGGTSTGVYELATSETELAAGKNIIIASAADDSVDGIFAMTTTEKTNNRPAVAVTVDGTTLEVVDGVAIIELGEGTQAGTYSMNYGDGYLYAASSSANNLKVKTALDANGNGDWAITIADGVASVVAQGTYTRNVMQFNPNSGDPIFNCYSSASQKALAIYVEATGGETFFTTEFAVAVNGETAYSKVAEALDAADAADTVELVYEAYVSELLDVYCTLDMAGFNLNSKEIVDASTSDGHIVDSVGTSVLSAKAVEMYETNEMLAINAANDGKLSYETVEVRQKNTVNATNTKVSFYINELADETQLDDSILAGADVKVRLTVKWTEGDAEKSHSFVYSQDLVDQYTADWDNKMFNCTITGMPEGATVIAEVVSCGVVVQAFVVA